MKTEESVDGAGRKIVGRPAPKIAIVRSTVARDPFEKPDRRIQSRTGAILSGTGANILALNRFEDDVEVLTLST